MLDKRGVTLFDALWAFYQEHEYCGELDGGVEDHRRVRAARSSTGTRTAIDLRGPVAVLVRVTAFG